MRKSQYSEEQIIGILREAEGDTPVKAVGLRSKADKVNIGLAQRLRKETTMPLKWIAKRIQMGSWSYVFNLLAAHQDWKKDEQCK